MNLRQAWYQKWAVVVRTFPGHRGRPGQVGGSLPKEGAASLPDKKRGDRKTPKELKALAASRGGGTARYVKPQVSIEQKPTVHELMFKGTLAAWKYPDSLRKEDGLSSIMRGKNEKYYAFKRDYTFEVVPTETSGGQVVGYFGVI